MNEENESNEVLELVEKYERALALDTTPYFDIDEIDDLLIYYEEEKEASVEFLINIVDLGIKLHPDDPEFKTQKIEYLCKIDRFEEAEALLSQYEFDVTDTLLVNIVIHTEKKEFDILCDLFLAEKPNLSEEQYTQALDIFFGKLLQMEEYQVGLNCLNKLSDKAPEDEPDNITRIRFNLHIHLEQYKEAIRFANIVIDRKPYEKTSWLSLAGIYGLLEDYPKMKNALEYAHAISPEDPQITIMLIMCLESLYMNEESTLLMKELENKNQLFHKQLSQWSEPAKNKMELSDLLHLFDHLCKENVCESMLPLFYAMKEENISEELMLLIDERMLHDPMNGNLCFIKCLIFMTDNRIKDAIHTLESYPMSENNGIYEFDDHVFTAVTHFLSGNRSGATQAIAESGETMGGETFSTLLKQLSPLIDVNDYVYALFIFFFWNSDELSDSLDEFLATHMVHNNKIYPEEPLLEVLTKLHSKLIQSHRSF